MSRSRIHPLVSPCVRSVRRQRARRRQSCVSTRARISRGCSTRLDLTRQYISLLECTYGGSSHCRSRFFVPVSSHPRATRLDSPNQRSRVPETLSGTERTCGFLLDRQSRFKRVLFSACFRGSQQAELLVPVAGFFVHATMTMTARRNRRKRNRKRFSSGSLRDSQSLPDLKLDFWVDDSQTDPRRHSG